ncbi:hypothetical protein HY498_00795 [Candidatus Woesearchaeota archaeon]|nr:hypothetical protein [Candidatus Woesearchaeota archaeon]
MTYIKLINEQSLSMAELKSRIDGLEKRDEKLSARGQKAKEYLNYSVLLDTKKAVELKEKLNKLEIPRLRERHFNKILDIVPKNEDMVKAIFMGENITVRPEDIVKILETVKEYAK